MPIKVLRLSQAIQVLCVNDLIIDDGLVAEDSLVIEDTLVADDSLAINVDDSNEDTHNADAFNADEFSFDLNESPVSESSDVTSAKDISMDFDFDFNETTPSNGVISTQKAEQSFDFTDNSLLGDDDLAEPVAPSVNQPIKDDLTFDLNEQAFDDDLSFAQPKSVETDNMPTATSAPASKLADDLSFVGASDGAQVTLDLAARYLNLGEHDSARRLLEEVMQSGNVTQQKTASDLLARL